MKLSLAKWGIGICVVALSACVSWGVPAIKGYTETWNSGTQGWAVDPYGGSGITLQNPADYLQVTFPAAPDFPNQAVVYATGSGASSAFTGDYLATGPDNVLFNFRAEDTAPGGLALYFANAESGRVWSYALTPPSGAQLNQWLAYHVGLKFSGAWTLADGSGYSSVNFDADLMSLDWIGVFVSEDTTFNGAENYDLDNWGSAVPEPEAVSLLLAVALSLGLTFRGKLGSAMARVRTMLGC